METVKTLSNGVRVQVFTRGKKVTQVNLYTPVFNVFKAGVTCDGPVTILRKEGVPFDVQTKRAFYVSLGYTVTEIN